MRGRGRYQLVLGLAVGTGLVFPVARLGGDEFAILLEQASSHEVAVRVAGRILEAMRPPFFLTGHQVQVGASVGVTVSDATEADVAMYTAKARGKGRFELASTSI